MLNKEHLGLINQGVDAWNKWRGKHADIRPDLSGAYLSGAYLGWANLNGANLGGTHLSRANLGRADLRWADLSEARLSDANLNRADLSGANLSESNLTAAWLQRSRLVDTNLQGATLDGCHIYGISAWNLDLEGATQKDLVITPRSESPITVDMLEVAQFIYLMLNNKKIRDVIGTIGRKAVLILGRFTPQRKAVLDSVREDLRNRGYLPIIFDFEKPAGKNLTETVSLLAHMARFVIADITDAKSIPQELQRIVPHLPSLPVQPIILESQYEYAMFKDFLDYHWVLLPHRYRDVDELLDSLSEKVIAPVLAKAQEIDARRKAIEREFERKG